MSTCNTLTNTHVSNSTQKHNTVFPKKFQCYWFMFCRCESGSHSTVIILFKAKHCGKRTSCTVVRRHFLHPLLQSQQQENRQRFTTAWVALLSLSPQLNPLASSNAGQSKSKLSEQHLWFGIHRGDTALSDSIPD
ncbi:hypothetical protein RRG08_035311 [Elysia crispata]|uniref:Uncharacterized protein n=1 Tax=Elysia crispata TaxID=231223 RepID=A0AAE0YSR4_9GAST|nr:hypothetical protein RRG08_035311 [Elysia crispata]